MYDKYIICSYRFKEVFVCDIEYSKYRKNGQNCSPLTCTKYDFTHNKINIIKRLVNQKKKRVTEYMIPERMEKDQIEMYWIIN